MEWWLKVIFLLLDKIFLFFQANEDENSTVEFASKVRYRVHKIFCIFQKIIHSIFTLFGNLPYCLLYVSLKANFIINGINRYRWTCKSEFSHPLEKLYQLFTYRHKYTCLKILYRTFFIKIPWKIFML